MMVVTIDVVRDAFSADQKRELLHRVTEAVVAVEGEAMRALTCVRIKEFEDRECALGGQPLSADELHRMAAARDSAERRAAS